ncbi:MAG: NAD(P)-dependent alcohol dehydrogenase [Galactobacter sp.]|uniref:NAD(P)-dependent alcohol dehydrogenase n=1 Tax=Galactobacter sp. TaxID=2676125 RepID=UPI0025B868F2|nr:NAD(P)-dependent alcohol dehydrogenase [Galactobacter sp.]
MSLIRRPDLNTLAALRQGIDLPEPVSSTEAPATNPEGDPQPLTDALSAASRGEGHVTAARGVRTLGGSFEDVFIPRRSPDAHDVVIEIEYCGLCHSDVHAGRGEWGVRAMPLVPGHEIVGRVAAVGAAVTAFKPGDRVGVGVMVASCRECDQCTAGREMYCSNGGSVSTYAAWDRFHGERTQGGYARTVVTAEDFVYALPEGLDPAGAAPLLCAGITTYSPLAAAGVGPGSRVAVAGIGGLGHLAVKIAVAMGATVTALTHSESKTQAALDLGAHEVVLTSDEAALKERAQAFDVIVDAIAAGHDVNTFLSLLRSGVGKLALIGMPPADVASLDVDSAQLSRRGLTLFGSKIGGVAETRDMLDFCAEHGVTSDVEVVSASQLDEAWDRMVAGDVRYRFVLDATTI